MSPKEKYLDERAQKEVAVDHQFLKLALSWLESAREEGAIASMADDLLEYLEHHFEAEERPGGFFDAVLKNAPRHESHVAELRAEHAALRESLQAVRKRIEAPYKEASEEVVADVAAFVKAMRDHERRENALIQDALERDFGAGD